MQWKTDHGFSSRTCAAVSLRAPVETVDNSDVTPNVASVQGRSNRVVPDVLSLQLSGRRAAASSRFQPVTFCSFV